MRRFRPRRKSTTVANRSGGFRQRERARRWRQRFSRFSLSQWSSRQVVETVCRSFNDALTKATQAFQGQSTRSYYAGMRGGLTNPEPLEAKVLLAADAYVTADRADDMIHVLDSDLAVMNSFTIPFAQTAVNGIATDGNLIWTADEVVSQHRPSSCL